MEEKRKNGEDIKLEEENRYEFMDLLKAIAENNDNDNK